MTAEYVITQKQLQRALASAKKRLPAYETLLNFYEKVFLAQLKSKGETAPSPLVLAPEVIAVKRQNGFPLINLNEFPIDVPAAADLFRELLAIFKGTPGKWTEFADTIFKNVKLPSAEPNLLFEKLLSQDDDFFIQTAGLCGVDARMLSFTVYHSLWPSLTLSARQLASMINKDTAWEKGYCPICGSHPGLAVLEEEGTRSFLCSFCFQKWTAKRLFCPYCENTDAETLHYFFAEKEAGYRVDVCERCGKYSKTVDLRELSYPFHPPLELVLTMHLDIKAREAGYESAVSPPLEQ